MTQRTANMIASYAFKAAIVAPKRNNFTMTSAVLGKGDWQGLRKRTLQRIEGKIRPSRIARNTNQTQPVTMKIQLQISNIYSIVQFHSPAERTAIYAERSETSAKSEVRWTPQNRNMESTLINTENQTAKRSQSSTKKRDTAQKKG